MKHINHSWIHQFSPFLPLFNRINFWINSVIIKLLPCFILTIISFVLIDVLCRANKRKAKLKGYSQPGANPNGNNRWIELSRKFAPFWELNNLFSRKSYKINSISFQMWLRVLNESINFFSSHTRLFRVSRLDRRTDRTTMLLVAVLILFLITEFPQGILGLLSGILGQWWVFFLDRLHVVNLILL